MDSTSYRRACQSPFWQQVFKVELDYLTAQLVNCSRVLSVGCGPAIIEDGLARRGFDVTGLDVSAEALQCAPDSLRTVVGRAEQLPFGDADFDAVVFVVSLQFIEDYATALNQAWRVLRNEGRLIVLLLDPQSRFFTCKMQDAGSYVRAIRHTDNAAIASRISESYAISTEYLLGIEGDTVFESDQPGVAALLSIVGIKQT